jgi:hypothetical protein
MKRGAGYLFTHIREGAGWFFIHLTSEVESKLVLGGSFVYFFRSLSRAPYSHGVWDSCSWVCLVQSLGCPTSVFTSGVVGFSLKKILFFLKFFFDSLRYSLREL